MQHIDNVLWVMVQLFFIALTFPWTYRKSKFLKRSDAKRFFKDNKILRMALFFSLAITLLLWLQG